MATPFARIDLAPTARDFRPIALEPGVPLLDQSSANDKIVFRWLGGMAAEPVWRGESLFLYVRDDRGGRLTDVVVERATTEELRGSLASRVAELRGRFERAQPETSTERALHQSLLESLQALLDDSSRSDLDAFFFKWRSAEGGESPWRVVWAWGYRRATNEQVPAAVCPGCQLLFMQGAGDPACPACPTHVPTAAGIARRPWPQLAIPLLLLLILAALGWWWTHPPRLVVRSAEIVGPSGSRTELHVYKMGLLPFYAEDVTGLAEGFSLDPTVARYDAAAGAVTLGGLGRTHLEFHLGSVRPVKIFVEAGPAVDPDELVVVPDEVWLAVGSTARLKLIGRIKDGTEYDLTPLAEWLPQPPTDKALFSWNGLLEGIGEGRSTVTAQYRATPESPPRTATAEVDVQDIEFAALEVEVLPAPVGLNGASRLRVDAVGADGRRYPVAQSSQLQLGLSPGYLGRLDGAYLHGEAIGTGNLAATFDDLNANATVAVKPMPGVDRLIVAPQRLEMVVGQAIDLSIASPSTAPVEVISADEHVVTAQGSTRLVARAVGQTQVTVAQGGQTQTIPVRVQDAEILALDMRPRLAVVPVDHEIHPRLLARVRVDESGNVTPTTGDEDDATAQPAGPSERLVELAPGAIRTVAEPSPRVAVYDSAEMAMRGLWPTRASRPQRLALATGGHEAETGVHVIVAPMRLQLQPRGPIELPLGQMMRLDGWAHYSGGLDVLVAPSRLTFDAATNLETKPGLELRRDRVAALQAGGGPLQVACEYFGNRSNRVEFTSVEADPTLQLRLSTDRTLRLVGETGFVELYGHGSRGDVELVPELARFGSTAEEALKVNERSGAFRAAAPGAAELTAEHPAAAEPTSLPFEIYEPSQAELAFDPPEATIAVDEVTPLRLMLQVRDGEETKRAELLGPGVAYTVGRPEAVTWQPPLLIGRRPAEPFTITGGLYPLLKQPATARIEVTERGRVGELRVAPARAALVPGQRQTLRVERLVDEAGEGAAVAGARVQWKPVRPEAVKWSVPSGVIFTPPAAELPPTVELSDDATGSHELVAQIGDAQATAVIETGKTAPDVDAEGAELVLDREPTGRFLAEGTAQRYNVMVQTPAGRDEPAANVRWSEPFENDYVVWSPPVLFAKRPGYQQWLRADVGGRTLLFSTTTYRPATIPPSQEPVPPGGERPVQLQIVSDQGPAVEFPIGARFDDFRVEAEYPDGFVRIVTGKANLRTNVPASEAPLSASGAMLVGVRPGRATVQADYMGLSTEQGLQATVTAEAAPDALRVRPSPATVMLDETIPLEVEGLKEDRSIGLLTGLPGVDWQSADPAVAATHGPTLTGNSLGKTGVTAAFQGIQSEPSPVSVVRSIADALVVDPKVIRLRVGQSVALGPDVRVIRGDVDLSGQCRVTPALPGVVRYDSLTHALVGVSPGISAVAFTYGDKLANVIVEVFHGGRLEGEIVVEPASGVLARGQALPLRVYVVTPDGLRIDRTTAAVFRSSAADVVAMRGNRACALAAGDAQVQAILPELEGKVGRAHVAVNDQPIEDLLVEPPQIDLGTGDRVSLRILGRAASGMHELFAQPDLRVEAGGTDPGAIRVTGANQVEAVTPGDAEVIVGWQDRLHARVPAKVRDYAWSDLSLEPGRAAVHPGGGLVYQLSAMRGGQRRVLTAADGVELVVSDPNVARSLGGMAVEGLQTGSTSVIARIGGEQAAARLDVVPGTAATGGDVVVDDGARVVTGPGYGTIIGDDWIRRRVIDEGLRIIHHGGRDVIIDRDRDVLVGPGTVPIAEIVGLQFVPEVLRMPTGGPGARVRVLERLVDGSLGNDVSDNPQLEISSPGKVASLERTEEGLMLVPRQPGAARLTANLGPMTADPMLVTVGEVDFEGARLVVAPDPLVLWTGQEDTFSLVTLQPGDGQWSFPVDYRVEPEPGQGVVEAVDATMLRGTAEGQVRVRVSAVAPGQPYDGISTTATVDVRRSDPIAIEPSEVLLSVGQATPVLRVYARADDGEMYQVPAELTSMDADVLVPDPLQPGQFSAKSLGSTQIRATYRGREALATVRVGGDRFRDVTTSLNEDEGAFSVTVEVLAAKSEGPLQYRVYAAEGQPAENWVPSQPDGGGQRAVLRSGPLPYKPRGSMYHLVLEAKSPSDGSVQRYPLSFRLKSEIERVGGR